MSWRLYPKTKNKKKRKKNRKWALVNYVHEHSEVALGDDLAHDSGIENKNNVIWNKRVEFVNNCKNLRFKFWEADESITEKVYSLIENV